jgi:hypothetical protein
VTRALLAAALLLACRAVDPVATATPPTAIDLETVPSAAVSGAVDGAPFTLREAWFRVERRAGRAGVDLILSEGRATRLCATSDPEDARHLWVRVADATSLTPGDLRGGPTAAGAVTAHWESRASGRWAGRVGSVALRVESADRSAVTGRLRACFGPGAAGCVSGTFLARSCESELDLDGPLAGNTRRAPEDGGAAP